MVRQAKSGGRVYAYESIRERRRHHRERGGTALSLGGRSLRDAAGACAAAKLLGKADERAK